MSKKVVINSDGYYPECQTCKSFLSDDKANVCPECGEVLREGQEKITVSSADIIVQGTADNPYYVIKYYNKNGECHIGYGSYDLHYVFGWLEEYFTIDID